jgi:hypothetical protein
MYRRNRQSRRIIDEEEKRESYGGEQTNYFWRDEHYLVSRFAGFAQ